MAGVYIHIPFCKSFCIYCDFYSELPHTGSSESFVEYLLLEMKERAHELGGEPVETVYFGGGTPSLLSDVQLSKIAAALHGIFGEFKEMTLEVNPEDVVSSGRRWLGALHDAGFNRVSMGVQSFDDGILRWMRRRHDSETAVRAVELLRESGFSNISLDLIFGFDGLTDETWHNSLSKAISLEPSHISAYQMTMESGSALSDLCRKGLYREVDDDTSYRQYAMLQSSLSDAGYLQYEVSNFSLPGMHSRHNSSYWHHIPYLGLGPGAHSLTVGEGKKYVRSWNDADLANYCKGNRTSGKEILSDEEVEEERIMLGLRCASGAYIEEKLAQPLVNEGLLVPLGNSFYRIPEKHFFISEYIISKLF